MRLRILLAKVNPEAIPIPTQCSYAGCSGRKFHLRKASQEILASYGVSASAGASLSHGIAWAIASTCGDRG